MYSHALTQPLFYAERERFNKALEPYLGRALVVTDSQALDVVHPWTIKEEDNSPLVDLTTFSIAMIQRQSLGRLDLFKQGLEALQSLGRGDRVLVAEACNHDRIPDTCNDIGMVQIPHLLRKCCGDGIEVEHAFGRAFPANPSLLRGYHLIIHCGACMIDHQKLRARIKDATSVAVPIVNYGLLLAFAHHGKELLDRVTQPYA